MFKADLGGQFQSSDSQTDNFTTFFVSYINLNNLLRVNLYHQSRIIFTLPIVNSTMAYENTVPIAVIVGFVTSIILLILVLRWLRLKNNQKKAIQKDLEAAKLESSGFDDKAWDALTPVASPQHALYYANARENRSLMNGYAAEQKMDNEWRAARMARGHA
jgi:hypothetical protein